MKRTQSTALNRACLRYFCIKPRHCEGEGLLPFDLQGGTINCPEAEVGNSGGGLLSG